MSAQDKTEQVLREMHIMYANSEVYDKADKPGYHRQKEGS